MPSETSIKDKVKTRALEREGFKIIDKTWNIIVVEKDRKKYRVITSFRSLDTPHNNIAYYNPKYKDMVKENDVLVMAIFEKPIGYEYYILSSEGFDNMFGVSGDKLISVRKEFFDMKLKKNRIAIKDIISKHELLDIKTVDVKIVYEFETEIYVKDGVLKIGLPNWFKDGLYRVEVRINKV